MWLFAVIVGAGAIFVSSLICIVVAFFKCRGDNSASNKKKMAEHRKKTVTPISTENYMQSRIPNQGGRGLAAKQSKGLLPLEANTPMGAFDNVMGGHNQVRVSIENHSMI